MERSMELPMRLSPIVKTLDHLLPVGIHSNGFQMITDCLEICVG